MKSYTPAFRALTIMIVMAVSSTAKATDFLWSGFSSQVWSVPGNWVPAGPASTNDLAQFSDTGSVGLGAATLTINVTSDTTVRNVWFGQTNLQHNMVIDAGVTLTIAGTNDNGWGPLGSDPNNAAPNPLSYNSSLYVGTKGINIPASVLNSNTISGPGRLVMNNTNNEINIRQANNGRATLNLSGLNTFTANLARIRVGDGEAAPLNRTSGTLFLAKTNTITLTGPTFMDNEQLVVGNNDVNSGNAATALFFGQQNTVNVDEILVGGRKQTSTMAFAPGLVNPSLVLRGSDGVSRVKELRVSDQADQSASGSATIGTLDLSLGTSDILADSVTLAKSQSSAGSPGTGTLTLGKGTFNINTFDLSYQMANNITVAMNATFNSISNDITVNNLLRFGRSAGGTGARNSTVNINRGSLTVNGSIVNEGVTTVRVTNAVVALTAHPAVSASVVVLDGASLSNAATIKVTNTFTLVNNAQIVGGNPVFDMGNSAAAWTLSGILGGSLTVSNLFKGSGSVTGNLIQAPGATLSPSGSGPIGLYGTVGLSGNLTLNAGTLMYDLGTAGGAGTYDRINGSGSLTLNGTNNVLLTALGGSLDKINPYTLIASTALTGNATYFAVTGPLLLSRYTFSFDTSGNTVKLVVSGGDPSNLNWVGDGLANVWDTQGALNWNNGLASQFYTLDKVTFGNSGSASPYVRMTGALVPGLTTVNSTLNYAFGGSGGMSVSGAFIKAGSGSLTITNTSDNSFNSIVTVSNGAVTLANSGQNLFAGGLNIVGGSVSIAGNNVNTFVNSGTPTITIGAGTTLSIANANANTFGGAPIAVDGTLAFNQPVDADLDSVLTRFGPFTKAGSGTLSLLTASPAFGGAVLITGGTIRAAVANTLGTNNVTITNTGALDVSGNNFGSYPIKVSGSGPNGGGALVNGGAPTDTGGSAQTGGSMTAITLTSDATFGGTGKWNTDPVLNGGKFRIGNVLSTGGQPYNFSKMGSNEIILDGVTLDAALNNINVQQGMLTLLGGSTLGDTAGILTVSNSATLALANSISADKNYDLFGDLSAPTLLDYNGQNLLMGAITLHGNVLVDAVDISRGVPISISLNGAIGGPGGLTKAGLDTLTLTGVNNYSGITTVSNGFLYINGDNQGTGAINVEGGTLAGSGQVAGPVTVSATGTLSPGDINGNVPAALDLNNNNLTLNSGTNVFILSPGSGLNTAIADINTLTVNGTSLLQVVVSGITPLSVGDTYTIFSFNGSSNATTNNLELLPVPFYTFALTNNGSAIQLKVLTAANQLTWNGTFGTLGVWDNFNTINWVKTPGGSHVVFTNGDFVTFDNDGTPTVTISGTVVPSPAGFIKFISTDEHPYTFQGGGTITGTTGIKLIGNGFPSILTIANDNLFSGPVLLDNGQLNIGTGGSAGSIGSAGMIASNSGAFFHPTPVVINRSDSGLVMNGNITGDLLLTNIGAGTVTLGGLNTFTGGLYVANGVVRIDNGASLGSTNNMTFVTNTGSLDVGGLTNVANGITGSQRLVVASGGGFNGRGAIVNFSTNQQQNALSQVLLVGDTVFGGGNGSLTWTNANSPGRWDIRIAVGATNGFLTTSNTAYSITKMGSNQVSLVNILIDPSLGDINIRTGAMSFEGVSSMGDPASNLTVSAGATLNLFTPANTTNDFTKVFALTGDGVNSTVRIQQGLTTLRGSMSLSGATVFESLANTTLSNITALSGSGSVIKIGPGTNIMNGTGSYSGNTTVRDGILLLKGSASIANSPLVDLTTATAIVDVTGAGGSLVRGLNQMIRGNGTIRGSLTVNSGATNSPGEPIGRLTVTNGVTLNPGSVTVMEVAASPGTNDVLAVTGGLQYGGSLIVVTNGVGNLSAGQTFKLFNSSTTPTGAFTSISLPTILPLTWTSNMAAGTITVVGVAGPTNAATILTAKIFGTNIVLHGTNNNVPNTSFHYAVLVSTNIAQPLSNWTSLSTNSFNGDGTFDFTNAILPSLPVRFFNTKAVP